METPLLSTVLNQECAVGSARRAATPTRVRPARRALPAAHSTGAVDD